MNATLTRTKTGDTGTFGQLVLADGTRYVSGELPWRDNAPQKSSIPVGTYPCELYQSPAHGSVYVVKNVPGRSYIEIHSANWFGDKAKGLRCDMLGCIGLGLAVGSLDHQDAILQSAAAISNFMRRQAGQPFSLTIIESYSGGKATAIRAAP